MTDIKGYLEEKIFPVKDALFKIEDELRQTKKELHASPLHKKFKSLTGKRNILLSKLRLSYQGLDKFR